MMRKFVLFTIAAGLGAAAMAASDTRPSPSERKRARIEAELAKLTPQAPVGCIDTRSGTTSLSAIGNKLIYRVSAKRIYVSDTAGGCEGVARGDTLVTRQVGSRLCRGDIATTVDPASRMTTGSCALGAFTPYIAP